MSLKVFGEADERTRAQIERCIAAEEGSRGVLCADNHLGYSMPIGGAVAYREHVSPSGVGYDIGCGNKAVRTDLRIEEIDRVIPRLMDEIYERISFGIGRRNGEPADHPVLEQIARAPFAPQRQLLELAARQLGTVGAGNHYVDLFSDEAGRIWVGVHFGSRGFGHKTASGFLAMAAEAEHRRSRPEIPWNGYIERAFGRHAPEGEMDSPPIVFPISSELGQSYIEAMTLAGAYAHAGRDVVVSKVLEILGAQAIEEVHNHHNYAWPEEHGARACPNCAGHGTAFAQPSPGDPNVYMVAAGGRCRQCGGTARVAGDWFWVVRKGCTPAFPGQQGFVGATMGEDAVILEGTGAGEDALYSTVHGAGRAMSRTEAAGKSKRRKVWECSERDCHYRAPFDQLPGGGRQPCPEHPGASLVQHWVREQLRPGRIDWPAAVEELRSRRIELRGGAADEAPGAYKRLDEVLAAHGSTIRIVHRLRPIGVAMAGADTYDPFKD